MRNQEVERQGRFLLLRDMDGVQYAVAPTALLIAGATDDGVTVAYFTGGRALRFTESLETVVSWFC